MVFVGTENGDYAGDGIGRVKSGGSREAEPYNVGVLDRLCIHFTRAVIIPGLCRVNLLKVKWGGGDLISVTPKSADHLSAV